MPNDLLMMPQSDPGCGGGVDGDSLYRYDGIASTGAVTVIVVYI
jgi:hypothetical protein